jgi:hypothetical protein
LSYLYGLVNIPQDETSLRIGQIKPPTAGRFSSTKLDEAQRIPGIGLTLKIISDQFRGVQLFVSGSSSFDLGNELNEPLTGRKWEYELFPISWEEYENKIGFIKV